MTNSAPAGATWIRNGGATADTGLPERSDDDLIGRAGRGEEQAFACLLRRHLRPIHHYLYRLTGSRADSDDLAQETFLLVWRKAGTYRPGRARFTTWLHRVAHNLYVDHLRSTRREPGDDAHLAPAANPGPEQGRRDAEDRQRLHAALRRLPANQRDAVLLCHQQGMSNREAAAVLGVGVRAVESLLARARRTLREELLEEATT